MKATLTFSPVCGGRSYRLAYLSNVTSLEQATIIGHNLVGSESIAASLALYLSGVALDNGDFAALPTPGYHEGNVQVSSTPFPSHEVGK